MVFRGSGNDHDVVSIDGKDTIVRKDLSKCIRD